VVVAVQPGRGWTRREAIAASSGIWMRSETVLAVSLSLGTRKVSLPKPPGAASDDETETCAEAMPLPAATRPTAMAATRAERDTGRGRDTELLFIGWCGLCAVSGPGTRCWRWSR
jgi:hypothetical protein